MEKLIAPSIVQEDPFLFLKYLGNIKLFKKRKILEINKI
jgi:hypothetical protein